jgi:hypothetical protein
MGEVAWWVEAGDDGCCSMESVEWCQLPPGQEWGALTEQVVKDYCNIRLVKHVPGRGLLVAIHC